MMHAEVLSELFSIPQRLWHSYCVMEPLILGYIHVGAMGSRKTMFTCSTEGTFVVFWTLLFYISSKSCCNVRYRIAGIFSGGRGEGGG